MTPFAQGSVPSASKNFSVQKNFRRGYTTGATSDLIVIGGGPGGYVAAIKAAQLGLKTTCVEKRPTLGGTCLNVGCIPSKALLNTSHMFDDANKHWAKFGIKVNGSIELDLPAMLKQKDTAVQRLTQGVDGLFRKNKVTWAKGTGTITGPNEVTVTDAAGKQSKLSAKNILIATGSDVMSLPGLEIDEKTIISSTGALSLPTVPKRMVVIGGGVIGLELVTVVEFTDKICAGADGQVATEFKKLLEKQGMQFKMNTKVTSAKKEGSGVVSLSMEPAAGGIAEKLEADVVLVAVGRRPYTDKLGLKEVGVALDNRGRVVIDHAFKTNVPSIRAIGDVVAGPMLAHKAEDEGLAAVELMAGKAGHVNYETIPSVIYTTPEVAWVGKTEEELKAAKVDYKIGVFPFLANSRAKTVDTPEGFVKFIAHKATDRILGCHIIGPYAGELIGEVVLGMEYGASTEDIARTCHAHPTLSEAVREAALITAFGQAIHF